MAAPVEALRADALGALPHGFCTRRGGVSQGLVAGLNAGFGAGDDRTAVERNRGLAAEAVLPGARLVGAHQVHSATCVTVIAPWGDDARPLADALVTCEPGLLLGILTADCAPVLLADAAAGVIGAAHAGWKGALSGVTDATVAAMVALGARREGITATIGPCIAQASYEVDAAFRERVLAEAPASACHFAGAREDHWQFDLAGYVAERLAMAGVGRVERLNCDTYADPVRFYSYRRATHRGEPAYGRQISLIGLAPER